jgi:hypothetical protein
MLAWSFRPFAMNVYLVPAANGRYALYCEVASHAPADAARSGTWRERLLEGFRRLVAEGEAAQRGHAGEGAERSRLRRAITRRIAEAVAEQRLFWHLRHETAARLVHPDDIAESEGLSLARDLVAVDFAKHRRWLIIDALAAAITGPVFFFVPGPNVISWYFAFRAIGHYFAMRGARQGLSRVTWTGSASRELSDLRLALALDREARARRVEQIAAALGLDRLAFFVERIA